MAFDAEWMGERFQDSPGHPACIFGLRERGQQNGEFIPTKPGEGVHQFMFGMPADRVALTNRFAQPFRHMRQQQVAHGMSQGIIDDLKAIQVDKQRGKVLVVALRVGEGIRQAVFEQHAVGETGETVVIGELMDGPLRLLPAPVMSWAVPITVICVGLFFAHPFGLRWITKSVPFGSTIR